MYNTWGIHAIVEREGEATIKIENKYHLLVYVEYF